MADVGIKLRASDETAGAFGSVKRRLGELQGEAARVGDSIGGIGARIGSVGVALGAALAGASLKGVIDMADQLDDLSEKTGIAVQDLSALRYAGEVVGTPIEALATGIRKLSQNMASAAGGSKESAAAFTAIGVEFRKLDGTLRSSDAVLADIANKFESFADGPEKAALALELFGKTGADMIPLLNQGASGMATLRAEGEALGAVFGGDLARDAAAFNDNLKRIELAAQAGKLSIAAELLPSLNTLAEAFIDGRKEGGAFAQTIGQGLAIVVQSAAVLGANVLFVLRAMGREVGAVAAQFAALARFDFAGFTAISDAVKEDGARARRELDALERRILGLATVSEAGAGRGTALDPRILGSVGSIAQQTAGWKSAAPIVQKPSTAAAVREEVSAFDQINASLQKRLILQQAELDAGQAITQSRRFELEAMADIEAKSGKLTALERERLQTTVGQVRALMEANDLRERGRKSEIEYERQRQQLADEVADAYVRESKAREDVRLMIDGYVRDLADVNEELSLEAQLLGQTDRIRSAAIEKLRIEQDLRKRIADIDKTTFDTPEDRAAEIARLTGAANLAKVAADARAELTDTQRILGTIEQTGRDVFFSLFDSGKNAFEKLGAALKASVIDLLYQMTARRWVLQIGAGLTGGLSGTAMAADAAGGLGSLGSVASGIGALAGEFGAGIASGLTAWTAGGSVTGAISMAFTSGTMASSLGTIAGALGPIAIGVALLASLAKKGETRQGAGYSVVDGRAQLGGGPSGGAIDQATEQKLVQTAFDSINTLLRSLGSSATVAAFEAGLETSSKGRGGVFAGGALSTGAAFGQTFAQSTRQSLTAEQAVAGFAAELNQATIEALQAATDLPRYVRRILADVDASALNAEQAAAVIQTINDYPAKILAAVNLTSDGLLQAFNADATGQALADTITGGITAALQGQYQQKIIEVVTGGIVTPVIDALIAGQSVTQALAEANLQALVARATATAQAYAAIFNSSEFQAALQAISQATREIVGAATAVLPASAQAVQVFAQQTTTTANVATETARANKVAELQVQILRLTGQELAAVAAERELELATLDDASQVLQRRVYALQDEAAALEKAKAIAAQRLSVEAALDAATGNIAAERARELAALDPAAQALQRLVYAIQDVQTAAEAARANTDGALAGVERAVDAQRKIATAAQQSANEAVQSLSGLFGYLRGEVDDLYSSVQATAAGNARAGLQFIDQALAAARVTGYLPDTDDLRRAVQQVRAGQRGQRFATQIDADRATLQLAGKLGELQGITGNQLDLAEVALQVAEDQLQTLDAQLQEARDLVNAARGIDTSVQSVASAIAALTGALLAERGAMAPIRNAGALATFSYEQVIGAVDFIRNRMAAGDLQGILDAQRANGVSNAALVAAAGLAGYNITEADVEAFARQSERRQAPETPTSAAAQLAQLNEGMRKVATAVADTAAVLRGAAYGQLSLSTQAA